MTTVETAKKPETQVKKSFNIDQGVVYVSKTQPASQLIFLVNLALTKKKEIKICSMGQVIEKAIKIVYSMQQRDILSIVKIETKSDKMQAKEDPAKEVYSNSLIISVK